VRWFRFLLVASLAVLVQTTLTRLLSFRGARPDLLIAVLVSFSLGVRRAEGFALGCILGLGRDLFSIGPFGLNTGVFALLGGGVAWVRRRVFSQHPLTHALFGLQCSVVSSVASLLAEVVRGGGPSLSTAVERTLVVGLGTAVVSALVGALVWRRPRWFGLRRRAEFEHV